MRQLTSLDAQFLAVEEDGRAHAHIGALSIYDPSTAPGGTLTLQKVRELIATRIEQLAPFRWRLAPVPMNLDHPFWVDDPDFDLDYHVRELALPAPGDDRQLADQIARLHARPLDRSRPLWELYLIHGVSGDKVALMTKIHHAAVDGVSGAELLGVLLDVDPGGRDEQHGDAAEPAQPPPGQAELLFRGVLGMVRQPLRALAAAPRTLPYLDQVPALRMVPGTSQLAAVTTHIAAAVARLSGTHREGDVGLLERRSLRAPRTRFNHRISAQRRFAFASLPLEEVTAIKDALGVTVNDVVLALGAGALRRWLAAEDAIPAQPLLAMVPVSVRAAQHDGSLGNQVSAMIVPLPTSEPNAQHRITAVNEVMRHAKHRHRAAPATLLRDANEFIPPALLARASRVMGQLAVRDPLAPPANVVISNVPGSPEPLYLAGAQLLAQYPVSMIVDGAGLNITVSSYRDSLDVGVLADRDLIDDAWPVLAHIKAELAELRTLTHARTASTKTPKTPCRQSNTQ